LISGLAIRESISQKICLVQGWFTDNAITIFAAGRGTERPFLTRRTTAMPLALYALTAGAFGIGVTEFVIMGLLLDVSADLRVSISAAGLLISGYALGVVVGAPLLGALTGRLPRKTLLLALMVVFTVGNLACALAPDYWTLMAARVLTAFAHASFFGVGSVVATGLVAPNKKASAIALMFTGLTVANILGVPFGTWLGQAYGWRSTFWAVTLVGVLAFAVIALLVPRDEPAAAGDEESSQGTLAVLGRRPVLLGLLTTVLSWVGVFAAFTYLAPMLTRISGFSEASVSPILLVFGGGLVVGNLLGGRLADRRLVPTVIGTLVVLSAVLFAMTAALHQPVAAIIAVGLLGAAAFATVAPLQMWVLEKAEGAGQGLASSFNIAAFNLGNAIGAWLGGLVIDHGPGLGAVTLVAALVPLAALAVVVLALRLERNPAIGAPAPAQC
jgi:DHA1 family inner membrane transport protein